MPSQAKATAVLLLGVLAFCSAATLIRLAQAPPLVIAFYRLSFASAVLLPPAVFLRRNELRSLSPRQVMWAGCAGMVLALHFALWITSLTLTSVASSVVLVTATPLFVGLASHFLLEERVGRRMAAGIGLSLAGGLVIGGGDLRIAGEAAWGDSLALLGALASTAYYLTGRVLRARISLLSYVAVTNTVCALVLAVLCTATGQAFTGYGAHTWIMLILLGLVPQAIGYSSVNWALGYVSATLVTVAILGEPVGSTLLAWLVLGEAPRYNVVLGGALILAGIYLAISAQGQGLGSNYQAGYGSSRR